MEEDPSAPELAEHLAQAQARIAELESTIAELFGQQCVADPKLPEPPSLLVESIPDALVAVDHQFRYVWVNAEAERMLRLSRDFLIGRTVWEVFPDIVGTETEQKLHEVVAARLPAAFESYYAPWEGWYSNRVYPTREGGFVIYWRDITEQKRLESELRRQALVLGQVHDALITTDIDGTITNWNDGAARIFGYAAREAVGQNISLLYFVEDQAAVGPAILEPLLRDGQAEVELRNRRKSGEECYIRLSLSLLRDETNSPYGMLGVSTDITAQRLAERAERKSEARYRCLADAIPHIAYVAGIDGKTEMVNRHWERFSGVASEAVTQLHWLTWVHPDDAPALMARWTECVRTGDPFDMEYRLRNSGGHYRWQLSRAMPVRDSQGAVMQWVGTLTDIDGRKQAEEALARSEERLRLALQAVSGTVYDWDLRTGRVHCGGEVEAMIGLPASDNCQVEWFQERVHPDDLAKSTFNLDQYLGTNQVSYEAEYRVRHASGHWVEVCERSHIVRDETGIPIRIVGHGQDVTVQKRLERDREETRARLKFQADVLETTDDAVIALDAAQTVTYCNAGVERMYGVRRSEVMGKPLTAIHQYRWLAPEDERQAWSDLAEHGSWKGENIHIRKDGTQLFVNSTVNLLPEGGGMIAVIRDVTARKEAELESRHNAAQLARANGDLLHFAYAVSHDLQTPLRTIMGFTQLIERRYKSRLDEEGEEFIKLITDASVRMATMLRDLLEFAKVAGGQVEFRSEVSLDDALASALKNLQGGIEESGAVIVKESLPTVEGDAGQLTQLFQNLIGNSLKYRKPETKPEVHVSADRNDQEWVITIRDNGIGFEANQAERIFGVFNRLHGEEIAGTGVGLAICKRIVERRGGRIWATAAPDEGAVFAFSIPTAL